MRQKFCLALIRKKSRTPSILERSQRLYKDIISPAVLEAGLDCIQVDPTDYGTRDEHLFELLSNADVVVVDSSARSNDYMYSLGVRHALSSKPTLIMVYAGGGIPFDIIIPRGTFMYTDEDINCPFYLRDKISGVIKEYTYNPDATRYSPVRDALEAVPRVFISYAHADRESAAAVDQWLRDRGVRVDIDEREFIAGRDLRNEIKRCIQNAGKVVCMYSVHSSDRYFTNLERRIVEELENINHSRGEMKNIMIYFRIDETELPLEAASRLAVNAWLMSFEEACKELLRHLIEKSGEPKRIPLSKYKKRASWQK